MLLHFFALLCCCYSCSRVTRADYSLSLAHTALNYSRAAYCLKEAIQEWTCETCAYLTLSERHVFHNETEGTRAFVGVSNDHVVVTFRGSKNIPNWIDNINFLHCPYVREGCSECNVHRGFYNAYMSLRDQVFTAVQELIEKHQGRSLLVTGHSLGGALALFTAIDLALFFGGGARPHGTKIFLYTFGKPRVGNSAFVSWVHSVFRANGHESYRITHKADIVPHLPPRSLFFKHVPHELWYPHSSDQILKNCTDLVEVSASSLGVFRRHRVSSVKEDGQCSNSIRVPSIADHLNYLGSCTSCSCHAASKLPVFHKFSEKTLKLIQEDHAYTDEEDVGKKRTSKLGILNVGN
ncbi:putative Lipase (class 3) [Trypanosoma vivax]|uniref:Putative lipase n=1 Tax=Trypanosoma vivax (strain Y486) TaxID=1055687 RepID=G0TUX7_TRYVY|nr:putative lipase [Trypanosoma vivax]KAH8617614.1 putative Lipase (class 3) [Trypanosoma vivax]CCC47764.1 putative lipase [Trypanosoma vivax Y486]